MEICPDIPWWGNEMPVFAAGFRQKWRQYLFFYLSAYRFIIVYVK
jgi:hypothetical protein